METNGYIGISKKQLESMICLIVATYSLFVVFDAVIHVFSLFLDHVFYPFHSQIFNLIWPAARGKASLKPL